MGRYAPLEEGVWSGFYYSGNFVVGCFYSYILGKLLQEPDAQKLKGFVLSIFSRLNLLPKA